MSKQYLYRIEILNKKNKTALDSISYYSGEDQYDINNSKKYESNSSEEVVWNNIATPNKEDDIESYSNLPDYLKFRSNKKDIMSNARNILWKNIDSRESRADSQFARLFELAIPSFLSEEESIQLIKKFSNVLVEEGMIIDCSLHNHNKKTNDFNFFDMLKAKDTQSETNQDYTAFLMCTLRAYEKGQFINKNRDWNNKDKMKDWRKEWLILLNESIINNSSNEEDKSVWNSKLEIYPEIKSLRKPKKKVKSIV